MIKKEDPIPPIVYHIAGAIRKKQEDRIENGLCPQCEVPLIHEGGCVHCPVCGWSTCE